MTAISEKNKEILRERVGLYNQQSGPRVGDYLILPDGTCSRLTYKLSGELMQDGGVGSFHLSSSGTMTYSGGLNDPKSINQMVDTGDTKPGEIWFFSEGDVKPGNGVYFKIEHRVYKLQ